MDTKNDKENEGLQKLQEILEKAVKGGADAVELEYVLEGLEVCYMRGFTGIGEVITDRKVRSAIIRLIVDRAKLSRKSRGVMTCTLLGKEYQIAVTEYDSFGESAFRLELRKPKRR